MKTTQRICGAVFLLGMAFSCFAQTAPLNRTRGSGSPDLAQQAADSYRTAHGFQLQGHLRQQPLWIARGGDFVFQPVIPFRAWSQSNLFRTTVDYGTSRPLGRGLNNVSIFDLIVFSEK